MKPFSKPCFWLILNHYGTPLISVYIQAILDWFGYVVTGTCVIRHRHKQREVAPATMFFRKTHAVQFINR